MPGQVAYLVASNVPSSAAAAEADKVAAAAAEAEVAIGPLFSPQLDTFALAHVLATWPVRLSAYGTGRYYRYYLQLSALTVRWRYSTTKQKSNKQYCSRKVSPRVARNQNMSTPRAEWSRIGTQLGSGEARLSDCLTAAATAVPC
jgi:hypothetical protein